jgi:predicted metal-dependent hydrolase
MNHSKRFYDKIYSVFPDYKKWDKWLKTNGDALMRRML